MPSVDIDIDKREEMGCHAQVDGRASVVQKLYMASFEQRVVIVKPRESANGDIPELNTGGRLDDEISAPG